MTRHIGASGATKIATNHEQLANGPAAEKKMDLANNATGRTVGSQSSSDGAVRNTCHNKATLLQLVTL